MDRVSPQVRSKIMAAVKGKNTSLERMVFAALRKNKIHFQKHYRKVPGCPDVAIPSKKLAVFIDGDFWHGRKLKLTYKKLTPFWRSKILTNVNRDKKNKRKLKMAGWAIIRVWGSDLNRNPNRTIERIVKFLRSMPQKSDKKSISPKSKKVLQ